MKCKLTFNLCSSTLVCVYNMATNDHLIQRQSSVHFSTRHSKGITHAEILDQIKRTIEIDRKKAIQITERDCIVTVNDNHTKI
jgi:hypothetical protein